MVGYNVCVDACRNYASHSVVRYNRSQNRIEQSSTVQYIAEKYRDEQYRAEKYRVEQNRVEQSRAEKYRVE